MDIHTGAIYHGPMSNLIVMAFPNTYLSSVGAVVDAHARLAEMFTSNRSLGDHAPLQTGLKLLTPDGRTLTLAGGRSLASDGGLDPCPDAALIYLPNAQDAGDAVVAPEDRPGRFDAWLRDMAARGVPICASGSSIWRVARTGLLDGRRASIGARQMPAFARAFPQVKIETQQPMTTSGPIMTCASDGMEPDFVIRAFDTAVSPGAALWLALHRGGHSEEGIDVTHDPLIARAQRMIRERFTDALRVDELAAALSVSHQTLIRRFRNSLGETPRTYIQGQKLNAAAAMFRETRRGVAEVAAIVGYADLPSFRAAFHKRTGATPSAYRASFAKHLPGLDRPAADD